MGPLGTSSPCRRIDFRGHCRVGAALCTHRFFRSDHGVLSPLRGYPILAYSLPGLTPWANIFRPFGAFSHRLMDSTSLTTRSLCYQSLVMEGRGAGWIT